ncbi:hypothetical protein ACXR2W_00790 [Leucobacter sp. HY1908]
MTGLVAAPDVVLWATGWLRAQLAERPEDVCRGVEVDRREPVVGSGQFPARLVVIGDSGSTDGDLWLSDMSLRVSVLAGSPESPGECIELARIVHALMRSCARAGAGSPVAAVSASRGPMEVPEVHPRARRLSTFDVVVVGELLP